jgi:succinate dehydrogenase / fumarate reductase, membrane anchor subunit
MHSRPAPQIGFSFEYLMWIFTRISGLALILLATLGVVGAFIMGARTQIDLPTLMRWTFFPNPNHVVNSNIPDVAVGWATAYWQIMEMMIVFFGLTHGLNGLRVVIEDYASASWFKVILRGLLLVIWIFMMIVAVYVILAS